MKKQSTLFKLYLLMAFIGVLASANAQIIETKSISCAGSSDGQLNVFPTFGTAPYTYLWSRGDTTSIIKGVSAGNYYVIVTDAAMVRDSFAYTITAPAPIVNTFVTTPNSSWPVNNGSFVVTTTGGSGSYAYTVTDSISHKVITQNTPIFSSLGSGAYYVTTSDLNQCSASNTVRIGENAGVSKALITKMQSITYKACYRSTGAVAMTPDTTITVYPVKIYFDGVLFQTVLGHKVASDTTVYTDGVTKMPILGITKLSWPYILKFAVVTKGSNIGKDSVTSFTYNVTNSSFKPGYHTLMVMTGDNKGYRYGWNVDSVQAPISITYKQVNNVCYGGNIGSITVLAQGSYDHFIYSFTAGPPGFKTIGGSFISSLYSGKYSLIVTDQGNCSKSQDIVITGPPNPILIDFDSIQNAICSANNGIVKINKVENAATPVTYSWSNGKTTQNIDSLSAGKYIATIKDANGCIAKDSVTVSVSNLGKSMNINFDSIQNTICSANNGAIKISNVQGISATPVSYSWSNGKTTQNIDSLSAGKYVVSVQDANGCTTKDSVNISISDLGKSMSINFDSIQNTICSANNGAIKISNVQGISATPVSYSWSNGKTTQNIDSLSAGKYVVSIQDANGCTTKDSVNISVSNLGKSIYIDFDSIQNPICTANNGSIKIHRVEGISAAPITYSWSNEKTTQNIDSLSAGKYTVSVQDANGCVAKDSVTLLVSDLSSSINVKFDSIQNPICLANNGSIKIAQVQGATAPLSYLWSNGKTTQNVDSLGAGKYVVAIKDANGCVAKDSVTMTISELNKSINIDFASIQNPICTANNGAIKIDVNGAVEPINYTWSNGKTTQDIDSLNAGQYTVNIKDANGCIAKDSVSISVSDLSKYMNIDFAPVQNAICTANNGAISIYHVNGAQLPVKYVWSNDATTQNISSLSPGNYIVTATDAYGCVVKDSMTIISAQPANPILIDFAPAQNVTCASNSGSIQIDRVSGGTQPFSFLWSNGATTKDISSLGVGNYVVTVKDADGCTAQDSLQVEKMDNAINIDFGSVKNVKCPYLQDGAINIFKVDGATPPISFVWSNGATTQNIDSLGTGIYSVKATDANGCVAQDSITVSAEKANCIYNIVTPNGDGYNDYLDLSDLCSANQMEAKIYNDAGKLVATLDENNPKWDGYDPSTPPTGPSSTFTVFIRLFKNGKTIAKIGESFSVIYSK